MSSRKENMLNTTRASKNIPSRGGMQGNITAIFPVSSSRPDLPSMIVQGPSAVDHDLLYDIAYSGYLDALTYQSFMTKQIEAHKTIINDQLSIYTEMLSKKLELVDEFEQEIKRHEVINIIEELVKNLDDYLSNILKYFTPEVEEKITKAAEVLEQACNHLYLNKVRKLCSQEECDLLHELINRCDTIFSKILNVAGNTEKYAILSDCLNRMKNLQKEVISIENSVITMKSNCTIKTLETVSDLLYENSENKPQPHMSL